MSPDINSFSGPIVLFRIFVDTNSGLRDMVMGPIKPGENYEEEKWEEMEPCSTWESAQKDVDGWIAEGYNKVRIEIEVG